MQKIDNTEAQITMMFNLSIWRRSFLKQMQ